jgi:hypothetical protein
MIAKGKQKTHNDQYRNALEPNETRLLLDSPWSKINIHAMQRYGNLLALVHFGRTISIIMPPTA